MEYNRVMVTFSREGERNGVELSKDRKYRVRVDNGPPKTFRSPWDQNELEKIIEVLRHKSDEKPTEKYLKEHGKVLGEYLDQIISLREYLADGNVTIHLQLDYPELAGLPWELATANEFPYRYLLEEGVRFVPNSFFRYLTGIDLPGVSLLLVPAEGKYVLFAPEPSLQAAVWTGPIPSHREMRERYGADAVHGPEAIGKVVRKFAKKLHSLPGACRPFSRFSYARLRREGGRAT